MRFIADRIRDPQAAEDIAQEIFLKIYRARWTFKEGKQFESWFWTIARNSLIDWSRTRKLQLGESEEDEIQDLPCPTPSAESLLLKKNQRKLFMAWLRKLTKQQQRVFWLRFVRQLSYQEISRKLGISLDSVKCLAYRSRQAMIATGLLMSNSVF